MSSVSPIDSGISDTIQQSLKLTMTKVLEKNGRTEMTISTEKEQGKRNSTALFKNNGFFSSQVCDFSLEKTDLPENTILYLNQCYLSHKDNKKICYTDIFIIGQITPSLNQPENLEEYTLQENEVKILRSKYDNVTGQFLGLEYCLAYLTFRGDFHGQFFDYGYSKENSKILYSYHKMKVRNSFSTTIFNRHRIQYEFGVFAETDCSNLFFFLPSTVDRIEDIKKYLGSINLNPIDIDVSEFGEKFDPPKLDFNSPEREDIRKSVTKVLRKVADLSSQNLKRNADGYLATVSHNNDSLLWPGGKRTQDDRFSLSY